MPPKSKKKKKSKSTKSSPSRESSTAIARRQRDAELDDAHNGAQAPTTFGADAPAWLREQGSGGAGFENTDAEDFVMPRIELVQKMSPVAEDEANDIEVGDMCDSITKELLANRGDPLTIIPVMFSKSRVLWESREPGSPMLCRSFDSKTAREANGEDMNGDGTDVCANCVHKEWDREAGEPPRCTEFKNFLCALPDYGMTTTALSMKTTNVKTAKRLASTLRATGLDMYAHRIELFSKKEQNDKGTFYTFDFRPAGFVDEDQFAQAANLHRGLSTTMPAIAHEEAAAEEVEDDDIDF